MANSNNICTRFINYVAVLILVFLSSQSFAAGGSFGGGGASGDWGEKCDPEIITYVVGSYKSPSAQTACQRWLNSTGNLWGTKKPTVKADMSDKYSGYCIL